MALTERTEIGSIEIVGPYKIIQIRHDTIIERDGIPIGEPTHRRQSITPDTDVSSYPQDIQDLVATVHTQAIKDAYQAAVDAQRT